MKGVPTHPRHVFSTSASTPHHVFRPCVAKRIVIGFRHLFGGFGGLEACYGSLFGLVMGFLAWESWFVEFWKEIGVDFRGPKVLLTIFGWLVVRSLKFWMLKNLFHVGLVLLILGSSVKILSNIPSQPPQLSIRSILMRFICPNSCLFNDFLCISM